MLDATVGLGGHAEALLAVLGPRGRLIGLDRDEEALEIARRRLQRFGGRAMLIHGDFGRLAELLEQKGVAQIDAALFDLGVSALQLETPQRGFSFLREGPLDMRMDPSQGKTAAELINRASQRELMEILRDYGQERWANRISRAIVRRRPLSTTSQLAALVRSVVPGASHGRSRIDPATRTFQAIRIAVNRELDQLAQGLKQAVNLTRAGGRIAVLAYHSLEDRIVKVVFREAAQTGSLSIVTRKPIRPSPEEVSRNARSRSACLRIAERR